MAVLVSAPTPVEAQPQASLAGATARHAALGRALPWLTGVAAAWYAVAVVAETIARFAASASGQVAGLGGLAGAIGLVGGSGAVPNASGAPALGASSDWLGLASGRAEVAIAGTTVVAMLLVLGVCLATWLARRTEAGLL